MYSYWDIDENKSFCNGGHIVRIAQGWPSGIIQTLKQHTSEVQKQQKHFVHTATQGYLKTWVWQLDYNYRLRLRIEA